MPEGDTIAKLATRINSAIGGERVRSTITRDPRLVGVNLDGFRLDEAISVGKYLLIRFERADDHCERVTLYSHLLMDGEWRVGTPARVPSWRRRIELVIGATTLTAIDVPELGVVSGDDECEIVGHLGPNLCGPVAPQPHLLAAQLAKQPTVALAAALLDQRRVAGFGNVFAVELPFLAGIAPTTPTDRVGALDQLAEIGLALIRWSAAGHPRNTTGRRLGSADHYLYRPPPRGGPPKHMTSTRRDGFQHTLERCGVCGERLWFASAERSPWGRMSWWCPVDQPEHITDVQAGRLSRLLALHPALKPERQRRVLEQKSTSHRADRQLP